MYTENVMVSHGIPLPGTSIIIKMILSKLYKMFTNVL